MNEPTNLRDDQRGAVLAEFVIAIVPILTAFFCFVQLAQLATARLVVKHGAIVGARAASVITNEHNNTPGQKEGGNEADITTGVEAAMGPWVTKGALTNVKVEVEDESSKGDPYGWVSVDVSATYHCNVPLGWIACGGRTKTLSGERARMPHQGANYVVEE